MPEPTEKSKEIEDFLTELTGVSRVNSVRNSLCTICKGPAKLFKDDLSLREYAISGMCQSCQDSVFEGE